MYVKLYAVILVLCSWSSPARTANFELTILHLNDFHARFEETNVYSGRCSDGDRQKNRCYGGIARLSSAVRLEREKSPNVLYLSAGDYFQGTIWYTVHKWRVMAHMLNLVPHDAMSFGNHEFDDGISGVVPFLENVTFPVLAANIEDSQEPTIQEKYAKSAVFTRGGRKIGVIGYVTTETMIISAPGKLNITDEATAVRKEARRLRSEEGVEIIIALGHSGFTKDMEIAKAVAEVDVVVGGHTNTFLYTGENPSTEPKMGDYPTIVKQRSGKQVPVVQAYAFGKYLGKLILTFNDAGDVTHWDGNPILLDNTIDEAPEILEALQPFRKELKDVMKQEVGRTFVFLDGNRLSCRRKECNLGNIETDAFIHVNAKYPDDLRWAHTSLAVQNGGGIRASIDERTSMGSITMEDILTVAPFQNTIDIVELRGKHVRQMFEQSVVNYDPKSLDLPGGFLQVSGFVVVYDINMPPGSRVVRLQARCQECRVPEMKEVDDDLTYRIAMTSFLARGGDGYSVIKDNKVNHHLTGLLDTDVYDQYIKQVSPLYMGLENRILFVDSSELCPAASNKSQDLVHEEGSSYDHYNMAPHEVLSEMMQRHDDYFQKHYVTPQSATPKKTGSSQGREDKLEGYLIQPAGKNTENDFHGGHVTQFPIKLSDIFFEGSRVETPDGSSRSYFNFDFGM
ncbi:snake venom 5'-nucleotidase-like [Homarus americanus]|nr:snake venom 5'-nucleotidase-like [Homarus americanus]